MKKRFHKNFKAEAESAEEAMEITKEKYNSGKFVLEPGELTCKQKAITSPDNEATEWTEF